MFKVMGSKVEPMTKGHRNVSGGGIPTDGSLSPSIEFLESKQVAKEDAVLCKTKEYNNALQ